MSEPTSSQCCLALVDSAASNFPCWGLLVELKPKSVCLCVYLSLRYVKTKKIVILSFNDIPIIRICWLYEVRWGKPFIERPACCPCVYIDTNESIIIYFPLFSLEQPKLYIFESRLNLLQWHKKKAKGNLFFVTH